MNETQNAPAVIGLAGLGPLEEIKKKLEEVKVLKEYVFKFIDEMFQENVDFGKGVSAATKPTLLLPGAEKLAGHFNLRPEWEADKEVHEMLGKPLNTVCLICYLVNRSTGERIGMGRGACVVGEKAMGITARDTNGSIKISEKRSFVNVVKNTFMLSERFSQDADMITSFIDAKKRILSYVQEKRVGIITELNDTEYMSKVAFSIIHKKYINTKNEIELVMQHIDEYDLSTGEKIKEDQ